MELYSNYRGLEKGACSTVIIGKNAAREHRILIGHNEDDRDTVTQLHYVPRRVHPKGEMIVFEDGTAVIPQAKETLAFFWSEARCPGGISFADSFINECGVCIVSDSCRPSRDAHAVDGDNRKDYALGYALRRITAERAHSAREAVRIAAELIETYGYCSSRTYHFADAEEAWFLAVPKGFRCAAQRIQDDEIYFIPNHFQIHAVHFDDPDNFYASPDVISFAREQGWFTGRDEEFDFAEAYQQKPDEEHNTLRAMDAWKILTGDELSPEDVRIPVRRAGRLYDAEDVKRVLRSHGEGERDITHGGTASPRLIDDVQTIHNALTVESMICVTAPDPAETLLYYSARANDICPYIPLFPLAVKDALPDAAFTSAEESLQDHFSFDPAWPEADTLWNTAAALRQRIDSDYARLAPLMRSHLQAMESRLNGITADTLQKYAEQKDLRELSACSAQNFTDTRLRLKELYRNIA
ncbi:MAG: C69 family dipeptidase [Solobacterium sp.]|nr:C69 family dipeptidase [Solobacterium sp.]